MVGTYYNTGEGGLHEYFTSNGANTIVQVASAVSAYIRIIGGGRGHEIKMGQGAKPGIGGHLPEC